MMNSAASLRRNMAVPTASTMFEEGILKGSPVRGIREITLCEQSVVAHLEAGDAFLWCHFRLILTVLRLF